MTGYIPGWLLVLMPIPLVFLVIYQFTLIINQVRKDREKMNTKNKITLAFTCHDNDFHNLYILYVLPLFRSIIENRDFHRFNAGSMTNKNLIKDALYNLGKSIKESQGGRFPYPKDKWNLYLGEEAYKHINSQKDFNSELFILDMNLPEGQQVYSL